MDHDLADELLELTRALRAHAEWQLACGTTGLPAGEPVPVETFPAREAPRAAALREAPRGAPPQTSIPEGDVGRLRREGVRPGEGAHPGPSPSGRSESPTAGAPSQGAAASQGGSVSQGAAQPTSGGPVGSVFGPHPEAPGRLRVLAEQAAGCTACGLHAGRKQAVFSRGAGTSGLCFVGEGPGADEDEQGAPFVGKAGQLLDRMIAAMGFQRDEVYVCNVVKCRPPNNRKPEPREIAACVHFLHQQIELMRPQVIVALGATAVEGLFGASFGGITRLRGRLKLYKGRIAVMPTFHPAYLLRNPAAKADVWKDLQEVVRLMGRELPQRK